MPLRHRAHGTWFDTVPGCRRRPALRLPRRRRLGPGPVPAAQPRQAAPRPLRPRHRGRGAPRPRPLRPSGRSRPPRRPLGARRPRLRATHAALRHRRGRVRLGRRRVPETLAHRVADLRGARQERHEAAPRRPRGAPRHVCRPGPSRLRRPPARAGCHGRRAAAGPHLHARARPRAARADEPLGLQHDGLLRAARRRTRRRPDPQGALDEFKAMVKDLHAAGIEVLLDVVYNHTAENSREHDDALVARARPARLLPRRRSRSRHRRHRMRQHPRPDAPRRGADGARLVALLGAGVPRRRLPLRPRRRARARQGRRLRHATTPSSWRCAPTRASRARSSSPSRGTSGLHGWRTGQFPPPFSEWNDRYRDATRTFWLRDLAASASGGVGHGVRELATRLAGSQDLFDRHDRGTIASVNFVTAHDGFTLADLTVIRHRSTTAPTVTAGPTGPTTTGRGTTGSRGAPTTPTSPRPGAGRCATCSARCCCRPVCRCSTPGTRSDAASAATTTRTPRTTRSAGCRGTSSRGRRTCSRPPATSCDCVSDHPVLRQRAFFSGRRVHADGSTDLAWFGADGDADGRPLGRTRGRRAAGALQRGRDLRAVGAPRRQRVGRRGRRHAARGAGRDGIRAPLGQRRRAPRSPGRSRCGG